MRAGVVAIAVLGLCSACASSVAPARHPAAASRPAGVPRFLVTIEQPAQTDRRRFALADARGRVVRTIATFHPKWDSADFNAVVSPDGRTIALEKNTGLYVERINSSRPRLLVRGGRSAVWSPDSKKVLVAVSNRPRLAVVTVATGARAVPAAARGDVSTDWCRRAGRPGRRTTFSSRLGGGTTNSASSSHPQRALRLGWSFPGRSG